MNRPIAIIGLDGATWDVIDPLLSQGKLPNIARLIERGAYGRLATLPDYTSPALWTTILTGKLPDKHGVFDFYTATGKHLRSKPIYEILNQEPIGLFQMYAVRRKDPMQGFVVPSRIEGSKGAYPEDLAFVLDFDSASTLSQIVNLNLNLLRHGVPLWVIGQSAWFVLLRKLRLVEKLEWNYKTSLLGQRMRGYITASLVKRTKPAFFASLFYTLDHLGHYYWRFWEPTRWSDIDASQIDKYGSVLPDAYVEVDKNIGQILRHLPESALVVVVSDHGMEAAPGASGNEPLSIRGLELLNILDHSTKFVTELLPPFRSIFRPKRPNWMPDASNQLISQLEGAKLPNGRHPFLVNSPNNESILVRVKPGVIDDLETKVIFPTGQNIKMADVIFRHNTINGAHGEKGVLIVSGQGVRQGALLNGYNLTDVTPTILALMGCPIAQDMDGEVILEAIDTAHLKRFPLMEIETYEDSTTETVNALLDDGDQAAIEARLRELGYLA